MGFFAELQVILLSLFSPWEFMGVSLSYLPGTIRRLVQNGDFQTITSWPRLQDAWFSAFWAWAGPRIREGNADKIVALFDGRVTGATVTTASVHTPLNGTVLDIGPGLGFWVDVYARINKERVESNEEGGLNIYGIEPNVELHGALRQNIDRVGLGDKYHVVPAGIQSLVNVDKQNSTFAPIEKGSVDCIVTLLCLCSIPEPDKNIAELYQYLKKGGRWYLYEHVEVQGNWMMSLYQRTI
ncbi:hypothetical protein S40285_08267 [Stachybotrys chlorohalonatus IBT 40285]|uniref:Methyltransferase type 11 domain-containing protein n=1 Tax=Stachybotrys chlorohalonatus (strain IBT 40285) TaxID=1283841 RepID=A0A084Q908_STAC4|nr:hypothetical protein S40285_08267 [Stachybotrys chlorohalonata IBT 40285]